VNEIVMEEPMITPNRKPQIKALIISKLSQKNWNFQIGLKCVSWILLGRADRENWIEEKLTFFAV